jgi:hypothetical protein
VKFVEGDRKQEVTISGSEVRAIQSAFAVLNGDAVHAKTVHAALPKLEAIVARYRKEDGKHRRRLSLRRRKK